MTDRVQPGGIDSIIRNDELAAVLGQFSVGGVIPGGQPSKPARRRSEINETVLDSFSLSTSTSSLDVTVAPGEAYIEGWCCRDVSTTLTLPANTTSEIVVGWNPDAVFDPTTDISRDDADETIVALGSNVASDVPNTVVHEVTTGSNGVASTTRIANVGGFTDISTESINDFGIEPVASSSDLPSVDPPQIVFIQGVGGYRKSTTSARFSLRNQSLQQSDSARDAIPRGIAFNRNGTKLFEIGKSSTEIAQKNLSTPFDLSTASFQQSINTQSSTPQGIEFSADGSKLFEIDSNTIFQSDLSDPFDISTANFQQSINSVSSGFARGLAFNNDGTKAFEIGRSPDKINESSLSNPFDISTLSPIDTIDAQDSDPQGLTLNDGGTRLFEMGAGSGLIYESVLSVPFDISTANLLRTFNSKDSDPEDIVFSDSGAKVFELDGDVDTVFESTCVGPDFVPL
jgi:hypothetical protein